MALSTENIRYLAIALGSEDQAAEIAAQIASAGNAVADNVAEIGATSNLVGVDGTGSNAAPLVGTESRLDVIEAKVDELIGALVAAGLMAA